MTILNVEAHIKQLGEQAKQAARAMLKSTGEQKALALRSMAEGILAARDEIKQVNAKDVALAT
ncbi:MAG: gamma-glutamyl-phosphate reductase, partial [Burkholderiaceae bacterium]|nr:gamma-glutamyl-phosphate reductase [Burkholderiaceae bacterium]